MSTGGIAVGQWFFPDWKAGGHGRTDVVKAIAESVNTFFYAIGGGWSDIVGLGPDRLAAWLERFGWGSELGIDLPGEASGVVPTPAWKAKRSTEPWYIGDTYHMAIGQGDILVTPLQVAAATAAIANNGTLYQPQMVAAIADSSGKLQPVAPRVLADRLASSDVLALVRRGMRSTVTDGSAQRLKTLPVEAAGKTGTAQVSKGEPHAWFSAFAPYDHPKIVLAIVVEHGGEGSSVAVPVADDVLRWWAQRRLAPTSTVDTAPAP
jgi:penicillin-binding protein 2